jgi:hypothetical protein
VCNDLRATETGGASFLGEPPAVGAERAWRQTSNDFGKEVHDPSDQFAAAAVKVSALRFLAGGGDAENALGFDGTRLGHQIRGHGHGPFQPGNAGFSIRSCDHAKDPRA